MPSNRPLILVTNDDGILADGIVVLARALEPLGEVITVAPSRQQSAVSHGISLNSPLRVRTLSPGRYAVAGTPADAVFMALAEICPRRPDLLVSGINHGSNLGTDVFYSGTVAGALEGAIRGIPAIAFSQQLPHLTDVPPQDSDEFQKANAWDPLGHLSPDLERLLEQTGRLAAALVQAVFDNPLPVGVAINVNGPSRPAEGYCWTRLSGRLYRTRVERRVDPRGVPYYWIGDDGLEGGVAEPGTDAFAVDAGFFSVTPIMPDWSGKFDNGELENADQIRLDGFSRVEIAKRNET